MENWDNEYLVNQIGALYWAAAVAHALEGDWDKSQRLIGEADRCKRELLRRMSEGQS